MKMTGEQHYYIHNMNEIKGEDNKQRYNQVGSSVNWLLRYTMYNDNTPQNEKNTHNFLECLRTWIKISDTQFHYSFDIYKVLI